MSQELEKQDVQRKELEDTELGGRQVRVTETENQAAYTV